MLNYFFTIKSHIIELFMVGIVMQYRFEIDVVPLLVGLVYLGVGDGGGFMEVVMAAYWYMWWPHGRGGGLLLAGRCLGGGSALLVVVPVNQE